MLSEAEADGLDIRADLYAYNFSSTDLGKKPFVPSLSDEGNELAAAHPLTFLVVIREYMPGEEQIIRVHMVIFPGFWVDLCVKKRC